MHCLRVSAVAVTIVALSMAGPSAKANDDDRDKTPGSVTVAFGAGLNTAQPNNTPNHHIIPPEIKVRITKARKLDGTVVVVPATVNFLVSGFHWVWVYQNGVKLSDVSSNLPPATSLFVNYEVVTNGMSNVFAKGVFPGTPPTFADAATFPLLSTQNRTDSFGFSTPGRYLVICNVRGHFVDGMYAWIRVVGDDNDDR